MTRSGSCIPAASSNAASEQLRDSHGLGYRPLKSEEVQRLISFPVSDSTRPHVDPVPRPQFHWVPVAEAPVTRKFLPALGEVMLYRPLYSAGFVVGEAHDGQSTLLRDGVDVDDVVHADDAPREDD